MKIYVVGGAVRDELLGLPVQDRDYVVVGATPEHMLSQGFRPVGKDFPVFLHPGTQEEYALARTERKVAPGYQGFVFHTDNTVTLEQDLARRDLTVNAMAKGEDGVLIDPYNGREDLHRRVLRHVSDAFVEDPVRILRIARFAARFADFTVAPETNTLMQDMVRAGEVDALVPERVWQELARGMMEKTPSRMFSVLRDCGALARILPELDALWGVPQPARYHPEIDTGVHVMMVLDYAASRAYSLGVRFSALMHDLGKGATPFMRAAKSGDVEMMKLLLSAGADPTATLSNTTALMFAAGFGWRDGSPIAPSYDQGSPEEAVAAIALMLDVDSDINAANDNGDTALHLAVTGRGSPDIVRFLISRGANLQTKNKRGQTPLAAAIASRKELGPLIEILRAAEAAARP